MNILLKYPPNLVFGLVWFGCYLYFSGSQSPPLRSSAPAGRRPGSLHLFPLRAVPTQEWGESKGAGRERAESWELDAWIVGMRQAGSGCQGELAREQEFGAAADSQVQGKARPGASPSAVPLPASVLSNQFFLPLGWCGG